MEKVAPKVKEASMAKDNPDRAARLAEALRENLRRRKAQARAQDADEATAPALPTDIKAAPSRP